MAYTINRYNNTTLTVVEDGTVDQVTDLKLVGKNYAGYGEIQNENFVFLLENFNGANPPPKAISGQIWFDSSTSKLKFFDGTKFRTTGGAEISSSAPSGLTEGDFWWDTNNEQLYAYNGADFVLVGPQDAGEGVTQMQSRTIRDTQGVTHSVITSVINDAVIHVISNEEFTIDDTDTENVIPGFNVIKKGLTLINTLSGSSGVTSSTHQYWGTASSAKGFVINGQYVAATEFIQTGSANFNNLATFSDFGLAVGNSNDLKIYVPLNPERNDGAIMNEIGDTIFMGAKDTSIKNTIRITPTAVLPGVTDITADPNDYAGMSVNIGSSDFRFENVYSQRLTGIASVASTMGVGEIVTNPITGNEEYNTTASADVLATPNTVAVRDSSGDIRANLLRGTALSAKYADLAEKYTTQEEYPVGTVLEICEHEGHEMSLATVTGIVAGVISENPAFLMNEDSDGQAVALKGRVPVRVIGPVRKGEPVFVFQNGITSTDGQGEIVGVALENNNSSEEKLIECFLKV